MKTIQQLILLLALVPAFAGRVPAAGIDPPFADRLAEFRAEAMAEGISAATLDASLAGLAPLPRVIELDRNQPEFNLTFDDYLQRVAGGKRIERGSRLLKEHRRLLAHIQDRYGVPPRILVALWGVESDFGRISGDFPVIAALATLAFDTRRPQFFRTELMAALRLLDRGLLRMSDMHGSWAGAMGELQFLPTVLLQYGIDVDSNGRLDLWRTGQDLFATGANYLQAAGWKESRVWGFEVKISGDLDPALMGMETELPAATWTELGVRKIDGRPLSGAADYSLLSPEKNGGRYFAVSGNYRALLVWNRSHFFALGVSMLADRLLAAPETMPRDGGGIF